MSKYDNLRAILHSLSDTIAQLDTEIKSLQQKELVDIQSKLTELGYNSQNTPTSSIQGQGVQVDNYPVGNPTPNVNSIQGASTGIVEGPPVNTTVSNVNPHD